MSTSNPTQDVIASPEWESLWNWLLAPDDCDGGNRVDIVPGDPRSVAPHKLHLVTPKQGDNARN